MSPSGVTFFNLSFEVLSKTLANFGTPFKSTKRLRLGSDWKKKDYKNPLFPSNPTEELIVIVLMLK